MTKKITQTERSRNWMLGQSLRLGLLFLCLQLFNVNIICSQQCNNHPLASVDNTRIGSLSGSRIIANNGPLAAVIFSQAGKNVHLQRGAGRIDFEAVKSSRGKTSVEDQRRRWMAQPTVGPFAEDDPAVTIDAGYSIF